MHLVGIHCSPHLDSSLKIRSTHMIMIEIAARSIYDKVPPPARSRSDNNATLLLSWWCTCIALTIILFRIGGRLVRTGNMFREDWVMGIAILPLFARMGLVHIILRYGTNNQIANDLTSVEIWERSTGSKLVLASRILYAAL